MAASGARSNLSSKVRCEQNLDRDSPRNVIDYPGSEAPTDDITGENTVTRLYQRGEPGLTLSVRRDFDFYVCVEGAGDIDGSP